MAKCEPGCGCAKHRHALTTRYDKTCEECGKSFVSKRSDTLCCSDACSQARWRRRNRERIRKNQREYVAKDRERWRSYRAEWAAENNDRLREARRQRYAEVTADPERAASRAARRRKWREEHRDDIREYARRHTETALQAKRRTAHNEDWEVLFGGLWEAQDGKCYLCEEPLDRNEYRAIHLDHDHRCCALGRSCERCRRGLACKVCNRLIGWASDDPAKLRRIAANLETALQVVEERMCVPRLPPRAWHIDLTCEECGTLFKVTRNDARYCSARCTNQARSRRRRAQSAG